MARQFLVDAGDYFQASEKLWGAASHMVIAEMHCRGIEQSGHESTIDAVATIATEEDPLLSEHFARSE